MVNKRKYDEPVGLRLLMLWCALQNFCSGIALHDSARLRSPGRLEKMCSGQMIRTPDGPKRDANLFAPAPHSPYHISSFCSMDNDQRSLFENDDDTDRSYPINLTQLNRAVCQHLQQPCPLPTEKLGEGR
jgi:hypothetical protein